MMFRSVLRRAAKSAPRAVSAISGNAYPAPMATQMVQMGFSSEAWLTEKQMELVGVTLKPEQNGKGFAATTAEGKSFMLYNASQTSDATKVEAAKDRKLIATYALTGERFFGDIQSALNSNMSKYSTNEWLTQTQVEGLGLALKPGAVPVTITLQLRETAEDGETATERTMTKSYFNIGELVDATAISTIRKLFPISVSTGKRYSNSMAVPLLRAALENKFTSPFWTTLNGAQALGLVVKDPSAGVDVPVSNSKVVTLFNACQTDNANKLATAAYRAQFAPRSAISGAPYPEPANTELAQAALKQRFRSVYWLTQKQAAFLGVEILAGQQPSQITMPDGVLNVFNAEQTTGKEMLEARYRGKN